MASGVRTVDKLKIVPAFFAAVPTSATPKYVSMKGYNNLTIVLEGLNTTGVTGSAVTVNQAKFVNGANAKACPIDLAWLSNDVTNSVALTQVTVSSNTFTTCNTANATILAVVEVRADRMDLANGFTALQVALGNATNSTINATYLMGNVPRYSGGYNSFMNPLAD